MSKQLRIIGVYVVITYHHMYVEYCIRLAYLRLNLTQPKSHGQGHAHFDCKYLENGDQWINVTIVIKWKVFRLEYLYLTLILRVKVKVMHNSTVNISKTRPHRISPYVIEYVPFLVTTSNQN